MSSSSKHLDDPMPARRRTILPKSHVAAVLREATGLRPGSEAVELLLHLLEHEGKRIAGEAARIATHAARRTILKEDVLRALERRK
jgi:histone H3/H4